MVGTSLPSIAGKLIETGAVDLISFWDPADAGYAMASLAKKILDGEKIEDFRGTYEEYSATLA